MLSLIQCSWGSRPFPWGQQIEVWPPTDTDLIKFAEQQDLDEEAEATEVTLGGDEKKSDEPEEAQEDPFENVADEAPTD